jgi:hypothetical protein
MCQQWHEFSSIGMLCANLPKEARKVIIKSLTGHQPFAKRYNYNER